MQIDECLIRTKHKTFLLVCLIILIFGLRSKDGWYCPSLLSTCGPVFLIWMASLILVWWWYGESYHRLMQDAGWIIRGMKEAMQIRKTGPNILSRDRGQNFYQICTSTCYLLHHRGKRENWWSSYSSMIKLYLLARIYEMFSLFKM